MSLSLLDYLENETPERLAEILQEASSNEQAYLMGIVDEQFANSVIELLQIEEQEELEEMMAYPEDSAGILCILTFSLFMKIQKPEKQYMPCKIKRMLKWYSIYTLSMMMQDSQVLFPA